MARDTILFDNIKTMLEDVGNDDIIEMIIDNVQLESFDGVLKKRRNKRKILEFLQHHFGLVKHVYSKGQRNYWIIRGFTSEQALTNSKQYSSCYSRSAENIAKKYNCSIEQATEIFKERNQRAQQTRDSLPEQEKQRINQLKRNDKQAMIDRYGEQEGLIRYQQRIEKYKYSVSLPALIERFGEQQGTEIYNKRKAAASTSLPSLISKFGEQEGRRRYQQQIERKAHAQTLQGYIDRYGFDEGIERYRKRQQRFLESWANKSPEELARINELRSNSLKNLQDHYGEQEGSRRYNKWASSRRLRASAESLKVFLPLYTWLLDNGFADDDIFLGYGPKKEFHITDNGEFFSYDFCIKSLNLIIEFNGLMFHPKTPDQQDWYMPHNDITAKQKFEYDQHKLQVAKQNGFKTVVL